MITNLQKKEKYFKAMNINKLITTRGNNEQEKQYLFSGLYGNKAVTKQTKARYINFDKWLKKHEQAAQRINKIIVNKPYF